MWKTGENLRDVTYPLYLYLAKESIDTNKKRLMERGEMEGGKERERNIMRSSKQAWIILISW